MGKTLLCIFMDLCRAFVIYAVIDASCLPAVFHSCLLGIVLGVGSFSGAARIMYM